MLQQVDRLSEAIKDIQKCLECTICMELMVSPVKTRCGHSFCQACIGIVLRKNAPCPLCKQLLNKRSVSKDDHLESAIENFNRLIDAIQTDAHIDILSYLKLPHDTRESCSNLGSSQSNISNKRSLANKRSICSNQNISRRDRPSTSRGTEFDCDNPRYDTNSLIQQSNLTSQTPTDSLPLSTDKKDNVFDATSKVKVRTWIHSLISTPDTVEDETRPSETDTSQVNKDTKRKQSSSSKKTDSNAGKLKHDVVYAKKCAETPREFADDVKSDVKKLVDDHHDDLLLTKSSDQTPQVDECDRSTLHGSSTVADRPLSRNNTWNQVLQFGKEMRGKKNKKKKLDVSTERRNEKSTDKSTDKSIEKSTDKSIEKSIEKSTDKSIEKSSKKSVIKSAHKSFEGNINKNIVKSSRKKASSEGNIKKSKGVIRIIEDVILKSKPKLFAKNVTINDKETSVSNPLQKSNSSQRDAINKKPDLQSTKVSLEVNERMDCTQESFTNDTNSSLLETNYRPAEPSFINLTEDKKVCIENLDIRQMNDIIGFKEYSQNSTNNANSPDRKPHLEQDENEEQEEDISPITRLFESPSNQQRLIVLTPEKLNESVLKRRANRKSDSQTPVRRLTNSTTSSENRVSRMEKGSESTTTTPARKAQLQSPNKPRLSLKRTSKSFEETISPTCSQVSLMERMSTSGSKDTKNVDSSVSKGGSSFDRLATVKRDLSSQIIGNVRSNISSAATAGVSGTIQKNRRLSLESTRKSTDTVQTHNFSIKFMQLGKLVKRRDVKYYCRGKLGREQHLPGQIPVISVYNMQQDDVSKTVIDRRVGNGLPNFSASPNPSNDSRDWTDVTVLENVHYVNKSIANSDNALSNIRKLPHGVSASSTLKEDADRRLDGTRTTMQGTTSKPSVAGEASRLPRTSYSEYNARQKGTLRAHSRTGNSIEMLSPEEDSQLKFLTVDSPMSQHVRSKPGSSMRSRQFELEKGSESTTAKDNLVELEVNLPRATNVFSSDSSEFQPAVKKRRVTSVVNCDLDWKDDDDSSDSAVSVSSECTIKGNKKKNRNKDKINSCSRVNRKRILSPSHDQNNDIICLDPDDHKKADERKFKRILSISDSDSESESRMHIAKKSNRNKSSDRCDRGSTPIMSTPMKRKSDENLRIRNIADKWSSEHSAAQKRSIGVTKNAQDITKTARLTSEATTTIGRRPSFSSKSSQGEKRESLKLSGKSATTMSSDLFFESNNVLNQLDQFIGHQSNDKTSAGRKSPSSMDFINDEIINKVLQIDRSAATTPHKKKDETPSQRNVNEQESNLLLDNFDEIIANVELPQSEDMISCGDSLPAQHRHNPDHNLNRTLTEQNTSSCLAMTNEPHDIARHSQTTVPASSTANIFEYCSYTGGKNVRKTHPNGISGNSDKENSSFRSQRKHDHVEEDRRDRKNVAVKSSGADDKVGREKITSKNNASQEKRGSCDRVEVTERIPRMEKQNNAPTERNDNESSAKDLSSEYDTLMNITLQQDRLKMLEEDLFGASVRVGTKTEKKNSRDELLREQRTPKKKKKSIHEKTSSLQEHSADEDDIVESTPETKMRNKGSSGKTVVGSSMRQSIAALSPIPSYSELHSSNTSSRKSVASKSEKNAITPLRRPELIYPLYQSTPKVTSNSMTIGHLDGVFMTTTAANKGQPDKRRATTSNVVSTSSKPTADSDTLRKTCSRQCVHGKLRFVGSNLTAMQIANIQKLAQIHNGDYKQQFDPSVTHVIVNTSGPENAAMSTLKYLQGIAHRKWVVSFKWIEDCIGARKLLPEDPYEATTESDINEPGPRFSRLSGAKRLFDGFAFLCIGPYDNNVTLSHYQDLLRATGATVVDSLEALAAEKKSLRGVVIQSDRKIDTKWYQDARAAPILTDWIVDCITHYKLFPLMSYKLMLPVQEYFAIGYSWEILGYEEYSDSSN